MSVSSTDEQDPKASTVASETDVTDAVKTDVAADPSTAKGDKSERSMLDAVEDALKPKSEEDGAAPGSKDSGADTVESGAKEGEDLGEVTEAELGSYKPRTRRRVEQLLSHARSLNERVTQLQPQAEQFQRIAGFMNEAGLAPQEINAGMTIMAEMKSNPVRAYELLRPYMDQLEQMVGVKLPVDLQKQVDDGLLTADHARELQRSRTLASTAEDREQRTRNDAQRQRQATEHQASTNAMASAVSTAEARWQKSDPDYQAKQSRVVEKIQLAVLQGQQTGRLPRTPQEAVQLAESCKKAVDDEFKRFAPTRREKIDPGPTGGSANTGRPAPANHVEALMRAVGQ